MMLRVLSLCCDFNCGCLCCSWYSCRGALCVVVFLFLLRAYAAVAEAGSVAAVAVDALVVAAVLCLLMPGLLWLRLSLLWLLLRLVLL